MKHPLPRPLQWYRQYCRLVTDPRIKLLAFEDRWHFMALQMLKGLGVLDSGDAQQLMERKVAVMLGVQTRELEEIARRLGEVGLIDPDTFQPADWANEQFSSDSDRTAAERKRRQRERDRSKTSGNQKLASVTNMSRVTVTRDAPVTVTEVTRTETDGQTALSSSSLELDWSYLRAFDEHDWDLISEALGIAPPIKYQDLLDELAGAWQKGVIQKAWADWFEGVCNNAAKGDFRVRHGRTIQADRRKKDAAAQAERERIKALEDAKARLDDPEHRARTDAALDAALEELGFKKKRG